jgi:hypothetical protein
MIKNAALFGLLILGGFLILTGDFTEKMIGLFLPIVALFLQERWALYDLAIAFDKNFETLEIRIRDHLNAGLDETE